DTVLSMSQSVLALANRANANIINDDIGFANDPFFQDGVIAQSINQVVSQGVTYLSAAGNSANQGYLSTFRPASTTVTNIGSGVFMNFDPSGGTNVELPITTSAGGAVLSFQYDQPFQTQEPAGSTGVVTSQVNIYVIDQATGAVVVGAAQN